MQSIPVELYEAAKIDGANRWQEFWYITWPAILPTTMIVTLLRTIWTASYVEHIQIMTGGGPGESTLTLPLYIFRKAYSYLDFGYGASRSMVLIIMLFGLVWVYLRLIKSYK
jgi:multiple sugar transport system permease protein